MRSIEQAQKRTASPRRAWFQRRPAASAREAIERSLPPLQRADATFFDRAGCISCHNNSLTAMTVAAARAKGFRVDENVSRTQLQRFAAFLQENHERALEDLGLPGGVDTVSYVLLGMAAEKYPSDWVTDAWARYLKNRQTIDGHWECAANRPPIESSDLEVTAASIKAIRTYGSKSQRAAYERPLSAPSSGSSPPNRAALRITPSRFLDWYGRCDPIGH